MFEEKFESLKGVSSVNSDSFVGLSAKEILKIEEEVGGVLPADYKFFLTQYGQVLFNESVGFKPINKEAVYPNNDETGLPNPKFEGSHVSVLFGTDSDYTATLESKIKVYKERMPNKVFPIGDDGLGNKLCIDLRKDYSGRIYWWDHENEWDEEDYEDETGVKMPEKAKYQNLYLIAKNFSEFIEKLYIVEV
jgi:hypothetical protein